MNSAIRRPTVGAIIDYLYNDTPGHIEVTQVDDQRIIFIDTFDGVTYDTRPVNFKWSTWDIHIDHTLDVVGVCGFEPTWEV